MKTSPLQVVKERFGDKEQLVSAVKALATEELWHAHVNFDAEQTGRISNAKLLRLHEALTHAKASFGTRAKLIDAILELEHRSKDAGYRSRLERHPLPRLLDQHRASTRRVKRTAAAASSAQPVAKRRQARSKKAQAKARAAR